MKTLALLTCCVIVLIFSCKKEKDKTPRKSITISGITTRDVNGNIITDNDSTDWTYDKNFPAEVDALFNFEDSADYSHVDTSTVSLMMYPNPVGQEAYLQCFSSQSAVFKFVIVDEYLKVYGNYMVYVFSPSKTIVFQLPDDKYPKNMYYRMYYRFYDKNKTMYYQGHGDMLKN